MMVFPRPLLVCDIGGTHVRCAFLCAGTEALSDIITLKTADFTALQDAAKQAIALSGLVPQSLIAAGAGPVLGKSLTLTNAPAAQNPHAQSWQIDGETVAKDLHLAQGLLLNDFEAQALSLPALTPDLFQQIGTLNLPKDHRLGAMQLVLGPGTGFGVGALLTFEGRHIPLPSEGSHLDFNAITPTDRALWEFLDKAGDRTTGESVLRGDGLGILYDALRQGHGEELDDDAPHTPSADVLALATKKTKGEMARMALDLYWSWIARFSGDLALAFYATGGVTLAGGVLPKLAPYLDAKKFRQVFENKAPHQKLMAKIPTRLIIEPNAALFGMAQIGRAPERYGLDYQARLWV